jgi:uncharacterized membrane protein
MPDLPISDPENLTGLLALGIACYAVRAGGFWMMGALPPSPWLKALLRYIPGSILVSVLVPHMLQGDPSEVAGIVITLVLMVLTRRELIAIPAGLGVVLGLGWFGV